MNLLIQRLRRERRLTLEQLGDRTGLSKSYLSKVEREVSTPSITAALKISKALDVDVTRLFVEDGENPTIAIDRFEDREPGTPLQPLGSGMLGKLMAPFALRPSAEFMEHAPSHPGQEFIFVHAGAIELHYDGEDFRLKAGDSAYLDATRVHYLRNNSGLEAQMLVITTIDYP